MKKLVLALALVLGAINMFAQDYDLQGLAKAIKDYHIDGSFHCGLAVAVKGNYYGYINKKGQVVIPFNYISAEEFKDNQAKVLKEGSDEYFFIDRSGNKIASPSGLFPDSKTINGKTLWGYVDAQGNTVVQYSYKEAKDFREGLARVQSEDGSYYFIKETGGALTDRHNEIAEYASDGFIRYKPNVMPNNATPKWGFLNRFGRRTIPANYYDAGDFSEGIAYVEELIGEDLWCGFIDNKGNKVHRTKYNVATYSRFKDGYIVASDKSGKCGYINHQDQPLTSFMFDYAEDFSEGLARVQVGDKLGFVDKYGNSTFNPSTTVNTSSKQTTTSVKDKINYNGALSDIVYEGNVDDPITEEQAKQYSETWSQAFNFLNAANNNIDNEAAYKDYLRKADACFKLIQSKRNSVNMYKPETILAYRSQINEALNSSNRIKFDVPNQIESEIKTLYQQALAYIEKLSETNSKEGMIKNLKLADESLVKILNTPNYESVISADMVNGKRENIQKMIEMINQNVK